MSEWLKVMLEEVARKKADAEEAELELQRRRDEEAAHRPALKVPPQG